jgi:hypothetical protein
MQPGGYGPLGKQIKILGRGRTNNPEAMPSPLLNKMQKENVVLPFPMQQIQKAAPPP